MNREKLTIIVPALNEEEIIEETISVLEEIVSNLIANQKINEKSEILFVDDGSNDNTWSIIERYSKKNKIIKGIRLSNNFGQQNAIVAGIEFSRNSDYVISIDADLQDDPNAIYRMIEFANSGIDIVYGVRNKRKSDSFIKRTEASLFYKTMNIMGAKTIPNHADFRLINRKVIDALLQFEEREIFLRGIFPDLGFKSEKVYYDRVPRQLGRTKYSFQKMMSFALDGITSFSTTPIKMVSRLGIVFLLIGLAYAMYVVIQKLTGNVVQGWSSIVISLWFIGGIQLIVMSVLGQYIGRIFSEVKHRPRYIISDTTGINKDDNE